MITTIGSIVFTIAIILIAVKLVKDLWEELFGKD